MPPAGKPHNKAIHDIIWSGSSPVQMYESTSNRIGPSSRSYGNKAGRLRAPVSLSSGC